MFLAWIIRNWKLVAAGVAVLSLLSAGAWFRGVLAERAELSRQNEAQAQEVANLSGEIERMNIQKEQDAALFEQIEQHKAMMAADLKAQSIALRKLRNQLDGATKSCFDTILPQSYLDGLPK